MPNITRRNLLCTLSAAIATGAFARIYSATSIAQASELSTSGKLKVSSLYNDGASQYGACGRTNYYGKYVSQIGGGRFWYAPNDSDITVYCTEPIVSAPGDSGTWHYIELTKSNYKSYGIKCPFDELRAIAYYGWGGPGYKANEWPSYTNDAMAYHDINSGNPSAKSSIAPYWWTHLIFGIHLWSSPGTTNTSHIQTDRMTLADYIDGKEAYSGRASTTNFGRDYIYSTGSKSMRTKLTSRADEVPDSYKVYLIDEGLDSAVGGGSRGQLLLAFAKTLPTGFMNVYKEPQF